MCRDRNKVQKLKARYRISNLAAYCTDLINRANVIMWGDESARVSVCLSVPEHEWPALYIGAPIQVLLGLKTVFRLPTSDLQGFAQRLRDLSFVILSVRNYTPLCCHAQRLQIGLRLIASGELCHFAVGRAEVKICGEGERKVRRHGYLKHLIWSRVNLALDANTGQVRASMTIDYDVANGGVMVELLNQIQD